ncbi:MAG: hypothetical protein OXE52_06710 [Chloroflexi bacterium]|nr:hypothetical protein [Chloroflexota bacterium]
MLIERHEQGKPHIASYAELRRERLLTVLNAVKEKWDTILILVVLLGGLVGIINPRFEALEANLGAKINVLDVSLSAKIDAVDAKFDNKFDKLAEMMIIAHTNGEATREELIAIWERLAAEN